MAKRDKWMIVSMMAAGFTGSFSQNLLTSALPSIMAYFQIDAVTGQWLTTSYILVLGIITCISAFLFARVRTKRLEELSLVLFLAGCVLALFAPDFPVLLLARVIQACGAGVLIPLLQIVVLHIYPPEHQGRALGLTGIIVGFAPAIGPTVSGILVDCFGWRSIFVMLILLSAVILVILRFTLRDVGEREDVKMDLISVVLYGIGFTAFMPGVDRMKHSGFLSPGVIGLFAAGAVCIGIFAYRQLHREAPVLKIRLLKDRHLQMGTLLLGSAYVLMMAGTILVPIYIQTAAGHSATVSGLILMPGSLLIAILSPVSGDMVDRHGPKRVCIRGMILLAAGCAGFMFFYEGTAIVWMILFYALRSIGLAYLMTACTTLGVFAMPLEDKAHATAILNSLRQMSGALFSAVLVLIATVTSAAGNIDMTGLHIVFIIMTGIAVCGIAAAAVAVPSEN